MSWKLIDGQRGEQSRTVSAEGGCRSGMKEDVEEDRGREDEGEEDEDHHLVRKKPDHRRGDESRYDTCNVNRQVITKYCAIKSKFIELPRFGFSRGGNLLRHFKRQYFLRWQIRSAPLGVSASAEIASRIRTASP
jgi:hypothetical protein